MKDLYYTIKELYQKNRGTVNLTAGCLIAFTLILLLTNLLADKPNEFGESAGVANALFSTLAFAGIIYALFLQRNELKLHREELKHTREELKEQRKEFEEQHETLRLQRFESTFFNMLSLQQEIVNGLAFEYTDIEVANSTGSGSSITKNVLVTLKGKDVFNALYNKRPIRINLKGGIYTSLSLKASIKEEGKVKTRTDDGHPTSISSKDYTEGDLNWQFIYNTIDYPGYLDHYFRHLYRIIKFVDESPLLPDSHEGKYQYTSMLRAQLSRYELVWLFYNGLSENGEKKFKPLIEKYALLKNLRLELLAVEEHKDLYAPSAFGKADSL